MVENIIYIHTHDSGRMFSSYGYLLDTPNIEEFSRNSHVFTHAFSVSPTCSPSRAALFSSRYPHENGMIGLCNRGFMMNDYKEHFVQILNKKGYETVLCGIQHEAAHFNNPQLGGEIIGYRTNITSDVNLKEVKDKRIWDEKNKENAIQWLNNRKESKPFFLSFGFFATHRPYPNAEDNEEIPLVCPPGFPNTAEIRKDFKEYQASVKHLDHCFGQLISAIKANDLWDKSMIIFSTDHGIAYPFGKSNLSDLGLGVALMIKLPKTQSTGVHDGLVSQLDLWPTICDYLNIQAEYNCCGKSLRKIMENEVTEVHDELYFEMNFHTSYEPARAIRTKRYKYIEYLDDSVECHLSNINESRAKDWYIELGIKNKKRDKYQLYDLMYDPDEKNNLVHEQDYQQIKNELAKKLKQWRKETKDKVLLETDWQSEWVVNKNTSRYPSSNNLTDYILGHEPINMRN